VPLALLRVKNRKKLRRAIASAPRTQLAVASDAVAEAKKQNVDFAPPLIPAGEERGLGGEAGKANPVEGKKWL